MAVPVTSYTTLVWPIADQIAAKRSLILASYLAENQTWVDMVSAIDKVWGPEVDSPTSLLGKIRTLYTYSESTRAMIESRGMLDSITDFNEWEKTVLVEMVNLLGLRLPNSDLFQPADFQRIFRHLAHFWYSKGTYNFIDFVGFCINALLSLENLWTQDYVHFYEEGAAEIGTPLWGSGPWYPTTHVRVSFDAIKFNHVDIRALIEFFYSFANYNLVLESIGVNYVLRVIDEESGGPNSVIVAQHGWIVKDYTIRNY